MTAGTIDYYEFLQISPNADADTIRRVYRFLAARLHPDNVETGDTANFQLLKAAYDVLSDPKRRAEYDATRAQRPPQAFSAAVDFMDALDGELNRRLAVLAVLYYRRRTTPNFPEVSLAEIEERMGFPRDYLDFTLWYLAKKEYIARADNATYALTAEGVDFVELQRVNLPVLNKLLTRGWEPAGRDTARTHRQPITVPAPEPSADDAHAAAASEQFVLPVTAERLVDRRLGKADRRVGAPDHRTKKVERRFNEIERRVNTTDRWVAA
ncbi:MAG: J domain-containing protein [Terracidiphilus sp.]